MTSPVSESCRPSPTGVGGAFYALLCALAGHCRGARRFSLCVLLAPLCVLSTMVFPPLTALYIRKALSGQDTSFSIGRTLKERLALFLKMEGVYLCLLIAALAALGIPAQLAPLVLVKPFSGSGSVAVLSQILAEYGADSYIGCCASVLYASGETVFYLSAIYFAGQKKGAALPAAIALAANLLAAVSAWLLCRL